MATITEIAVDNPDFSILVGVLQYLDENIEESDLVAALSAADAGVTVFAPTNDAFGALATDLGYTGDAADETAVSAFLTENVAAETLFDVVTYHVSPGIFDSAAVSAAESLDTLNGATIAPDLPTLVDAEPDLLDPSLVATDIEADNGIVHVIDRVLLPIDLPGNDAETIAGIVAASGGEFDDNGADFDLLLTAVSAAGLVDALADETADLTVFAPDDDAFLSLASALGYSGSDEAGAWSYLVDGLTLLNAGDPIPLLTTVLTYHVAPGSLQSSQVLAADGITTLAGPEIGVTVDGDAVSFADLDPDIADPMPRALDIQAANGIVHVIDGVLLPADLLASDGADDVDFLIGDDTDESFDTGADADYIDARGGDDVVIAGLGDDTVLGGAGADRLNGGDGDDRIVGGPAEDDLADVIFAGAGDDTVSAGAGNDTVYGMDGSDALTGGAGADFLAGQAGDDVLAGNGLGDVLYGNEGADFLNGGYGYDRVNGGAGADTFFHLGVAGHGTDWVQDFTSEDTLFFGAEAEADDFVLAFAETADAGEAGVAEAFITYAPTGQVIWALVDGAAAESIDLQIAGDAASIDLLV
ncbi:serralysin [Rhodovulum iodosum]|uniref:Serralysin n=1 Tax=Rhodovulum iodosum TaxID=68291 RepID=A0ABV3XQS0_9RHOB|nr:fasciclin domain-containing protein [Rhodovulum robiginosum]RSK32906.1 hypothetical protein EJA01_11300 [Rhodovulum robiginosum]